MRCMFEVGSLPLSTPLSMSHSTTLFCHYHCHCHCHCHCNIDSDRRWWWNGMEMKWELYASMMCTNRKCGNHHNNQCQYEGYPNSRVGRIERTGGFVSGWLIDAPRADTRCTMHLPTEERGELETRLWSVWELKRYSISLLFIISVIMSVSRKLFYRPVLGGGSLNSFLGVLLFLCQIEIIFSTSVCLVCTSPASSFVAQSLPLLESDRIQQSVVGSKRRRSSRDSELNSLVSFFTFTVQSVCGKVCCCILDQELRLKNHSFVFVSILEVAGCELGFWTQNLRPDLTWPDYIVSDIRYPILINQSSYHEQPS